MSLNPNTPPQQTYITLSTLEGDRQVMAGHINGLENKFHSQSSPERNPFDNMEEVQLVEAYPTNFQTPLYDLYTRAVQRGRRSMAKGLVAEVFPGVENIEILTEGKIPIVYLVFRDHSVPASLAGDGIQSLLRLSLALAASEGGVALLEEPEVHQHLGAMRQSARAIVAAVRRGIQVVLTTHSLELIDALLSQLTSPEELDKLSLYRLQLTDGILKSSRLPGPEIQLARGKIEEDLR
jgi:predicted ATPase